MTNDNNGAPREQASWTQVTSCPSCGCEDNPSNIFLPDKYYKFGKECITFPDGGIFCANCKTCGLIYKKTVPSPSYLSKVISRQSSDIWHDTYNYASEVRLIEELVGQNTFALIDIGPSGGELLRATAEYGGTRSALDCVRDTRLGDAISGEFIHAFLDDHDFMWSNAPYDVVTAFDVLEHLYNPSNAFKNLRSLVKPGGYVILETGDVESFWPKSFGLHEWWYIRLFEHHVFWSEKSLSYIVNQNRFEIVRLYRKKHKSKLSTVTYAQAKDSLKTLLYVVSPQTYPSLARAFGKRGFQPWSPFATDHFQAVLKAV